METTEVSQGAEVISQYQIEPTVGEPLGARGEVSLTIAGRRDNTLEQNQEAYGEYIARQIVDAIKEAQVQGKIFVFDFATGGSPEAVWPALERIFQSGEVDLSRIVFTGHEEGFGPYTPGSKSDFDHARRKILRRLGVQIQDITDVQNVTGESIQGNFIPMHLAKRLDRNDFPDGEKGDDAYFIAEVQAAFESAQRYHQVMSTLAARNDVIILGLCGVGSDGHYDEIQSSPFFHPSRGLQARDRYAYAYLTEWNSYERGFSPWIDPKTGEFNFDAHNIYWQRGQELGGDFGVYGGIYALMGCGWPYLTGQDYTIIVFNKESKRLAFQLAIEGSVGGAIEREGEAVMQLSLDAGEGEAILHDLEEYALQLEDEGILEKGTVEKIQQSESFYNCQGLFLAIYDALYDQEASPDDPKYRPIYEKMWEFANRYQGKRAPVSMAIHDRMVAGKPTEIVAAYEVVKGTKYEALAA